MTNRKERRSNPDQWWKLTAYFDADTKSAHGLGEEFAQYVKGAIGDIVVLQVPVAMPAKERVALMHGFHEAARLAGEEHRFLIVPDSVRFARVQPMDATTCKSLDRQLMVRRVETNVRAAKSEIHCPHGRPKGQPCPHCMGLSSGNPGAGGSA